MDYKKLIEDLRRLAATCDICHVNGDIARDAATAIETLLAVQADLTESLRLASKRNKDLEAEIGRLKTDCQRKDEARERANEMARQYEYERDRLQAKVDKLSRPTLSQLRRLNIQYKGEIDRLRAEVEKCERAGIDVGRGIAGRRKKHG